jgi:hypothetical protein
MQLPIQAQPVIRTVSTHMPVLGISYSQCNVGKQCQQDSDCGFITQGCFCQNGRCVQV